MRSRTIAIAWLAVVMSLLGSARPAAACSPPFEEPTITALGPAQVVVVGTTGEHVAGGRLIHVERWFNGDAAVTPIVIAFKEGEPVGDCSYPMASGTRLIIAPYMEGGHLSADLGTLQADPDSETGRRYVEEATRLFGPGVVPAPNPEIPSPISSEPDEPSSVVDAARAGLPIALAVAVMAIGGAAILVIRRRRV